MIVIHVGLKKCGSGSIQTFLDTNAVKLKKVSVNYPRIGRTGKAHHNLAREIRDLRDFDRTRGTLSDCAQFWRKSQRRVMVLSSEVFEDAETSEAIELKRKLLAARGSEEFRIYAVVRNLVDLMPSSYAQKIKRGFHSYDFDTFFAARMEMPRVDFFDTITRWADAFGWESMQVRILDRAHLLNGDLLDDLLDVCGVEPDSNSEELVRTGVRNTAPGWRVLEATRALRTRPVIRALSKHPLRREVDNKIGARDIGRRLVKCAEAAGEMRGWNSDRGRYLTWDQARRCHETYRGALLRLNEKLPQPLPVPDALDERSFCAREFLPAASHIPRRELSAFYDDVWERLQENGSEPVEEDRAGAFAAAEQHQYS